MNKCYIVFNAVINGKWDEFLHKLPMNQHQKKEYLKSMNQVLQLVFRKTSNHQSNLELPKQVF